MANEPNKKLLVSCINILEKYSNKESHTISLKEDGDFFSMACKNPLIGSDQRNNYQIARFKALDNIGFNFSLKFYVDQISEKKLAYNLTDANIKIFALIGDRKQLLFRAEFAMTKPDKNHAQPHWQFEPYISRAIKDTDYNSFIELKSEEVRLFEETPALNNYNISKFHFCMTSDWHKPQKEQLKNSHIIPISEDNVIHWLDGCLQNIVEQFTMYK